MRKFLVLLAALMVFAACQKEEGFQPSEKQEPLRSKFLSYAEAVDIAAEAASMLENPNQSRSSLGRRVKLDGVTCRVKNPTRSSESADSLYYVVNYEDEAGFALVAARRDAPTQLLAVTEAGSYSAGETTENEGFNMYVKAMENSIENTTAGRGLKDSISIKNSWYETEEIVGPWYGVSPLVDVRWGQGVLDTYNNSYFSGFPYNKYCYDENGLISLAGCSIVAIAQLMSHHEYPTSYILNFAGQNQTKNLDWDAITTWIGGPSYSWSATAGDEIALWFRQLGKTASAQYDGSDGTGVDVGDVRSCLSSYGYTSNSSTDYDYDEIRENLLTSRPVYVYGDREKINSDGTLTRINHAWVADGYLKRTCTSRTYEVFPVLSLEEGETTRRELVCESSTEYRYVHYNWGFDGDCNGYFTDGCFNLKQAKTEAGGYDYSDVSNNLDRDYQYDVRIITGIRPNN